MNLRETFRHFQIEQIKRRDYSRPLLFLVPRTGIRDPDSHKYLNIFGLVLSMLVPLIWIIWIIWHGDLLNMSDVWDSMCPE